MIMTATLITVAPIDSRITKREKDFCWLKAIRRAIKAEMFNRHDFSLSKIAAVATITKVFYLFILTLHIPVIDCTLLPNNMKPIFLLLIIIFLTGSAQAQIPDAVYSSRIQTAQLFPYGNQLGYPAIKLNSSDRVELHFDDLDGNVKNYSYTFQLCNADWTPSMLGQFDFIRGFLQQRITNYRVSSIALTRYTHYQALLPDQNCAPSRSGNYILKVFLNGDTSKLIITKRMLVIDDKATVVAQVQQPFNGQIFKTHQKIQFKVNLPDGLNVANPMQQIKVVIMQNFRWDNAIIHIKPTFFSRNALEYNTENDAIFPAGKEWRWVDLRSFRYQSDRILRASYGNKSTDIIVKPDANRVGQRFVFFRDGNGLFNIGTTESINPLWQTDYATVHFSFVPPDNASFANKDLFIIGKLNNYNTHDSAKMIFNPDKGVYERSLFLKQGYYDYAYVTIDQNDRNRVPSFEFTEGNYWETENDYMILVYYRALAGRADELIGVSTFNSLTNRQGLGR
jgi:hypothetical protein